MSEKREPYTKEVLIAILRDLDEKLGHTPTRKDVPFAVFNDCRIRFGKWCYALEAAGVKIPSETTLTRRAHNKARWKREHKRKRPR